MSRTYPLPRKAIPLDQFGQDVLRRREAAGTPAMPRNTGDRRTASKDALLAALRAAGGDW